MPYIQRVGQNLFFSTFSFHLVIVVAFFSKTFPISSFDFPVKKGRLMNNQWRWMVWWFATGTHTKKKNQQFHILTSVFNLEVAKSIWSCAITSWNRVWLQSWHLRTNDITLWFSEYYLGLLIFIIIANNSKW